MRRIIIIAIAIVITIGFLIKMMTFTVNFTQKAVVTTFGQVSETGVIENPGLKFKWPAPIQAVTVYDTRARVLRGTGSQVQLADERQVVVEAFLTWRVSDPRQFYRAFNAGSGDEREHYNRAECILLTKLRSAFAEFGRYSLDELFTDASAGSKLGQLEDAMLAAIQGDGTDDNGVTVDLVGISRVVLPESVTAKVIDRMQASREAIAQESRSQGEAQAATIRAEAENAARRIIAFADVQANEIRAQGETEAAQWLAVQAQNEELAAFLRRTEFLRRGLGQALTLVLPPSAVGVDLFDPQYIRRVIDSASDTSAGPGAARSPQGEPGLIEGPERAGVGS